MHGRILVGIGSAVLIAAPAGAAARCAPSGAKVVARDGAARVLSVAGRGAVKRRYIGCLTSRARRVELASDLKPKRADETHVTNTSFRIAGSWVAWHHTTSSDFGAGECVEHRRPLARPVAPAGVGQDISRYGLKSLRVAANGDVAWVLSCPGNFREVDGVAHTTTTPTPLAVVPGVDSASLSVGGGTVRFTVNGEPRTEPLHAPATPPSGGAIGSQGLDGRFGDCGTLVPARPRANVFTAATQLARAPGGALVSAGTATSGKGDPVAQDEIVVARFSSGGAFDASFGAQGVVVLPAPWPGAVESVHVTGLAVQADGRIVVAGYVLLDNAVDARTLLVRLNPDGSLDPSFGTAGVARDVVPAAKSADLRDLGLDADGNLLIAGQRDERYYVARLTPAGAPDPAFGAGGVVTDPGHDTSAVDALALAADGTIFAGGGTGMPLLMRFDRAGTLLSTETAGPPATGRLLALEPTADGGVVGVGTAGNVNNPAQALLARYGADGRPATGFGADGFVLDPQISSPSDIAVAADGALYVTASFSLRPGRYAGSGLVRYSAGGARDASFVCGALGGTSSYGLANYDVLLGDGGTAYVAQDNGGAYGVSRVAVGEPAIAATAGRSTVCAMATTTKLTPLVANRRLDVSLRLRAPGTVHLDATVTANGRTLRAGQVNALRPFTEGAIASIPLSKAAVALLRRAKSAKLVITAGAPGRAKTTYRATLSR